MKTHEEEVKKGKKNRAGGGVFEKRVRIDLESKGWTVDRWTNNVEFYTEKIKQKIGGFDEFHVTGIGKLIPAKVTWRRTPKGMFPLGLNSGFPDFICFRKNLINSLDYNVYRVIGVECKTNGTLTKLEREKCQWYLDNGVFSKILIAEKTKRKNRIVVVYHNFVEKYGK